MGDTKRSSTAPDPNQEPGHYGAGYGEQVPEDAPPQLGPATDGDPPVKSADEREAAAAQDEAAGDDPATTREGDDGEAVVFTPADVHARPPDQPPTDAAPESEKAGLIFERS
jgi:hypothetical protein